MPRPAPTPESEIADIQNLTATPPETIETAIGADPALATETIAIELNFNAFADHVPPTQHARRVASHTDPSVQDFADQALEIATLRAELGRLTRDYDALQHAAQVRDARMHALQTQLVQLRGAAVPTARETSRQSPSPADAPPPVRAIVPPRTSDAVSATRIPPAAPVVPVPADTGTVATDMTATIVEADADVEARNARTIPQWQLVPLDAVHPAILLHRDIITVGRTRDSDVCIVSSTVSRDHARLLLGPRGVTLVDMNSANGCFVNDERVRRHRLRDGDRVRFGERNFRFAVA